MNITSQAFHDTHVLSVAGRLDGNTAGALEAAFTRLVAEGSRKLVFHFADLQYISSAGLRVILVAAKSLRASQGRMICSALQDQVRDVFEMSGFTTILELTDNLEDALESMNKPV